VQLTGTKNLPKYMKTKTKKVKPGCQQEPCSGFGVRIIHPEWSERVFYYWTGGAVSVEGKETRKRAIKFDTLEAAIECAKGIREWLLKSRPTPIDWQICKLPSWRVAKKSLPNNPDQASGIP
jgi:hypothetical protein